MKKQVVDILLGVDFIVAAIVSLVTYFLLPTYLEMEFTLSFYNTGISVLSIVFSVFFAALAIIISASDNDFIEFMEEKGHFSHLIWTLKFTLIALFISLLYSIILYISTNYYVVT